MAIVLHGGGAAMRLAVLGLGVLSLISSNATAAEHQMNGNRLQSYCSGAPNSVEDIACTMYLQGYAAGIEAGDGSKAKDKRIWCFPEGATVNQARLVVEKFMRENPAVLHESAAMIVTTALILAFPCSGSR